MIFNYQAFIDIFLQFTPLKTFYFYSEHQTPMKFLSIILIVTTSAFFILLLSYQQEFKAKESGGEDSPLLREQWAHDRYANPATGEIPSMGLWKAYQQLVAEGKIPAPPFVNQATARTEQWELVNDFFSSLAITKIVYDPTNTQTFYFCTGEGFYNADEAIGAGVFKSTDGGNTWNQLPSTATSAFNYCLDMDVHPITGYIYVATLSGLMRSKDGGQTWQKVLIPPGSLNHSVCDVEFTKNGSIFATSGVFITGAIYFSETGDSASWVKQTNGFPTTGILRVELATAPSNDSVAYAVACNSSDNSISDIYKTVDKGNTWEALNYIDTGYQSFAHKQAWYDLILAVDPNDANTVAGGGWHFFRTRDGGIKWQQISHGNPDSLVYQYVHVDEHAIVFRNSDTVYFGCDGGVWKCNDFTDSLPKIFERNYGYRVTQYYSGDINPEAGNAVVIGGTQDNGSNKMIFGGVSPQQNLTGYDGAFCAINYQNPNVIYTTKNSNGVFRFTNGGFGPADTITNHLLTDNDVQFINPIILDNTNPEILYQPSNKGLWRLMNASTANDTEWVKASKPLTSISAIAVSTNVPHTVFVGRTSGGNVYRMDHADTTSALDFWKDCDPGNQLPNGNCSSIYVDPLDVNHVFVTFSNYGINNIWESKNADGAAPTWQHHDGELPDLPVNWIFPHPTHPEVCYIGTDLGMFYTTELNGDSTVWQSSNVGLANVRVNMLTYRTSDHTLLAATHGRGMFTGSVPMDGPDFSIKWTERGPLDVGGRTRAIMIDPNDATGQTIWAGSVSGGLWKTTSIDALPAVGVPPVSATDFSMNVFPNPVSSGSVNISLSFSQSTTASVFIYDDAGRLIHTFWKNQKATSGTVHLQWQPQKNISQGVYYVCAIVGERKFVKKVVYLR